MDCWKMLHAQRSEVRLAHFRVAPAWRAVESFRPSVFHFLLIDKIGILRFRTPPFRNQISSSHFAREIVDQMDSQSSDSLPQSLYAKYAETLEAYCEKHGFGAPYYERSVVQFKDNYGRDVQFYNYKITVPALVNNYGSFQWTKLWQNDEEAREAAARFVFLQLGILV